MVSFSQPCQLHRVTQQFIFSPSSLYNILTECKIRDNEKLVQIQPLNPVIHILEGKVPYVILYFTKLLLDDLSLCKKVKS